MFSKGLNTPLVLSVFYLFFFSLFPPIAHLVMSSHLMPVEIEDEFIMELRETLTITGISFSKKSTLKQYCLHYEWNGIQYTYRDNVNDPLETVM